MKFQSAQHMASTHIGEYIREKNVKTHNEFGDPIFVTYKYLFTKKQRELNRELGIANVNYCGNTNSLVKYRQKIMKKREKQFLEAVKDAADFCSTDAEMSEIEDLYYQDGDLDGEIMCNISLRADMHDLSTVDACSTDRGDQPVGCTNIQYNVEIYHMPYEFMHLKDEVVDIITSRLEEIYE